MVEVLIPVHSVFSPGHEGNPLFQKADEFGCGHIVTNWNLVPEIVPIVGTGTSTESGTEKVVETIAATCDLQALGLLPEASGMKQQLADCGGTPIRDKEFSA